MVSYEIGSERISSGWAAQPDGYLVIVLRLLATFLTFCNATSRLLLIKDQGRLGGRPCPSIFLVIVNWLY
jgi:hypothetical protein